MSNIKDQVRRQILSLDKDEVLIVTAVLQSLRIEKSSAVKYRCVPDAVTKADCKRLIKTMRAKQSGAPSSVQQTGQRAITHIRNVWIPQIKSHDQQAD